MGAMDDRNIYSNLAVNKYLHTVASGWICINIVNWGLIVHREQFAVAVMCFYMYLAWRWAAGSKHVALVNTET